MTRQMPNTEISDPDQLAEVLSAYTEVTERLRGSHDKLAAEVARLREELASKNLELERSRRLAALGEMAAGIAHEIRNPLGGIALYAGLLVKQLPDRPKSLSLARRIGSGVDRLDGIVSDVLAFAGEITPQKRQITLVSIAAAAHDLVRGRFEQAGTRLICHADSDASCFADHTLLIRAIGNLLFNASDAAGEGEASLRLSVADGNVWIEVCDSGAGIDATAMDKIFDPFFTTKDTGTGLGLAIVHRIADSHGGHVHVSNSQPPEGLGGARFCMVLPQEG